MASYSAMVVAMLLIPKDWLAGSRVLSHDAMLTQERLLLRNNFRVDCRSLRNDGPTSNGPGTFAWYRIVFREQVPLEDLRAALDFIAGGANFTLGEFY